MPALIASALEFRKTAMSAYDHAATLAPQIGLSLALTAPVLALRRFALSRLVQSGSSDGVLRAARIRALATAVLIASLGFVWIAELQSLLLSVTAVLMALVIATKELIQCGTGALARRAGRSFRIGDHVHLDGTSGRVSAVNVLTTTIEETEARGLGSRPTGRRLVIPNSRILAGGIHVEDAASAYRRHAIALTFETTADLHGLLCAAEAAAARQTPEGAPEARVALSTSELGKPRFEIVLFCAPGEAHAAERRITLELLERASGETANANRAVPALSLVANRTAA